jgi:predicted HTH domain antitoxin
MDCLVAVLLAMIEWKVRRVTKRSIVAPLPAIDSFVFASNVPPMNVELPDAPVIAAGLTADEARLRVAFSLYREGRLSTPQCAELAGLSRRAFMDELARHRVEAPYALADLEADATTLKELGPR